jgi:hypothetical protein
MRSRRQYPRGVALEITEERCDRREQPRGSFVARRTSMRRWTSASRAQMVDARGPAERQRRGARTVSI